MKRYIAIISAVFIIAALFFAGCKKSTSDAIAFVGDEKDMMSCYDLYPEQYFPYKECNYDTLLFPPDIVGEYEIDAKFVECTYECYMGNHYIPVPSMADKTIKIIIEEQVNGMAKLKFSTKKSGDYGEWYNNLDAYIYGDVYADGLSNNFIVCYEYVNQKGEYKYDMGSIVKGTIDDGGISNIHIWYIIKDRYPKEDKPQIYKVFGYEHYHADFAARK